MEEKIFKRLISSLDMIFYDQFMRNCYDTGIITKERYIEYLTNQASVISDYLEGALGKEKEEQS